MCLRVVDCCVNYIFETKQKLLHKQERLFYFRFLWKTQKTKGKIFYINLQVRLIRKN